MSLRIHIAQPRENVEVGTAAANLQLNADRAQDLQGVSEWGAGEYQDIGARLKGLVLHGTGPAAEYLPARRRRWGRGVVLEG